MQAQQQKTFNTALQKQNNLSYGRNLYINSNGVPETMNEMVLKQNLEEEEHEDEVYQIINFLVEYLGCFRT